MLTITPQHLPGVAGATTVETPGYREIGIAVRHLHLDGGIIIIDGKPGVGKTYGTRAVLSQIDIRAYWVDMPSSPKGKEANARIYKAITGHRPPPRMTEYELTEETVDALSGLQAILVIDEAQNMSRSALQQIRYLHDRESTQVTLLLVGPGVAATVRSVPELESRLSRRVQVTELNASDLRRFLPQFHPVLAATDSAVITSLAAYAKGNLRNWAHIIEASSRFVTDPTTGISATAAKHVLRAISGGRQ